MANISTFMGMDVHKNSIDIAIPGQTGYGIQAGTLGGCYPFSFWGVGKKEKP